MTESFSHYEIEDVIIENRKTVEKRGEPFGVDREILSLIFDNVNSYNDIEDKRARISRKVAYLLGGISYHQPFNNGNKETALAWTIYFLRKNGFDLPRRNLNEKRELYDLMIKTSFKFENDPTNYHRSRRISPGKNLTVLSLDCLLLMLHTGLDFPPLSVLSVPKP